MESAREEMMERKERKKGKKMDGSASDCEQIDVDMEDKNAAVGPKGKNDGSRKRGDIDWDEEVAALCAAENETEMMGSMQSDKQNYGQYDGQNGGRSGDGNESKGDVQLVKGVGDEKSERLASEFTQRLASICVVRIQWGNHIFETSCSQMNGQLIFVSSERPARACMDLVLHTGTGTFGPQHIQILAPGDLGLRQRGAIRGVRAQG